ncbi:MAG: aspartate aminotransferase family protein [Planctomycetota bacterium]
MNREEVVRDAERFELPTYKRVDIVAERGEGCWIHDAGGRKYLDLYGGHAVTLLGHSPTRLADAIAEQAHTMFFYSNVVHCPSRVRAAKLLAELSPFDDAKVFFCNSGAEANETALKMARKVTGRQRVLVYDKGFHGRTLGALAASDLGPRAAQSDALLPPEQAYHLGTWGELPDASFAAVLVEPIQSMGGMRTINFAAELRARCDETGTLLIHDEVQTAPARTGDWFFSEVKPDLITTAKGIASGFPAGVVIASGAVAGSVEIGDQGTTFGGGPMAATAIETNLTILREMDAPARALAIEAQVRQALPDAEVRGRGSLLGIVGPGPEAVARLREEFGVLVGGCPGDKRVLRLMPPLIITDDELAIGLDAIRSVLA